jgi:penicillin-binding protein 1A
MLSLGLLAVLAIAVLSVVTPSGADIQERVARIAAGLGVRVLAPGQVPDQLARALIATEDERFFQHHGIDALGAARAAGYDLVHACGCQGGSTLTEQLVKVTYLGGDDSGWNKVVDTVVAFKVETAIGKREILADYCSVARFGYGIAGAALAARAFFGRPLAGLDLAQVALIAGMPRAPSALDPRRNPAGARQRRDEVLRAMVSEGYITGAAAASAAAEPLLTSR